MRLHVWFVSTLTNVLKKKEPLPFCHTTNKKTSMQQFKNLNKLSQNNLCSVSLWLRLFPGFFFFCALSLFLLLALSSPFFNCRIIHLRALIYPPPSGLYVQPSCEGIQLNAKWGCLRIKSLFQGESTYLWTRLLVFPSTLTLWARTSVCHLFHSGPGNVLEREVPLFPLVWCLHRSSCGDNAR